MNQRRSGIRVCVLISGMAVTIMATTQAFGFATPLRARGYTLLPPPQQVELTDGDVTIDESWKIGLVDVKEADIAVQTLAGGLREQARLNLSIAGKGDGSSPWGGSNVIRLMVKPGTVQTGLDEPRTQQAYQMTIGKNTVEIAGNGPAGLFYGVQSLLQLLKPDRFGHFKVPQGVIRDWPQYQLRIVHWDTKHHQDRIETLKRYLDWLAKFKINMVCFELEDKFEYPSHPIIGAPGAFTTEQLQDLVNYGLARHIQIVPNIQAPAHMGFVLKHDEFKHLRSDGSNYMAKFSDPRTYELIFDMYTDVINATQGVEYLHVSTDEVYYAGIDPDDQKVRPYNPENRSLWFAEFVNKAHEFAAKHGRRIFLWVEFPLLPQHVQLLPADVIDGIVGNEDYVAEEKKRGIRTLAYVSMQGAELLFPGYFPYPDRRGNLQDGRLKDAYETPIRGRATRVDPIGTFSAAWDDSGLHNETFWLGWAAMGSSGWHPGGASTPEIVASFMELYYGQGCEGLIEAYRDLQQGARFWEDSWDEVRSKERPPAYGYSGGKRPVNRTDELLLTPNAPALPDLTAQPVWKERYKQRVEAARAQAPRNERLRYNLQAHLTKVQRNRYNLEVLMALAELQRHQIDLILGLDQVERDLLVAGEQHRRGMKDQAVGLLVKAHDAVARLVEDLDATFARLKATWEKSMFPAGRSVAGREFVYVLDSVKDHWAFRRPDLTYMIASEQRMKLPEFRDQLNKLIHDYAAAQNLGVKGLPDPVLED